MNDDDGCGGGDATLQHEAIRQYQNKEFQAAAESFETWKKRSVDEVTTLSLAADEALCRFRACTNWEYQEQVLYRQAIVSNGSFMRCLMEKTLTNEVVEAALLACVSAVWIHLKMNNIKMARHKAWDVLQWSTSSSTEVNNTQDAVNLLSRTLASGCRSLHKFQQVLNVLNLLQDVAPSLYDATGDAIEDQQEAIVMLANNKTGKPYDAATLHNGVASKVQTLIEVTSQIIANDNSLDVYAISMGTADALNRVVRSSSDASDINLLGCFQAGDCKQSLATFAKGLKRLRPNSDRQLRRELTMNLAECFKHLGEHNQAKKLFIWLRGQEEGEPLVAESIIPIGPGCSILRAEVLWKAFVSSTMDGDLLATLKVSKDLYNESPSGATVMALVFALHQAQRPSLARQHLGNGVSSEHAILLGLNQVSLRTFVPSRRGLIAACLYCNLGVLQLREGNSNAAIVSFERARAAGGKPYLHPHYNLTLLLLQTGEISRAVELWGQVRRVGSGVQHEVSLQIQKAAQSYRESLETNVHPQTNWTAKGIGGLLSSRVLLLDCVVLQYRLQQLKDAALQQLVSELES